MFLRNNNIQISNVEDTRDHSYNFIVSNFDPEMISEKTEMQLKKKLLRRKFIKKIEFSFSYKCFEKVRKMVGRKF